MAASEFNPYREWLGIESHERPTFYRLLGLTPFEASPPTIEAAADERIELIRRLDQGGNAALSQQIVRELEAARRCLLSTVTKAEYDAVLRRYLAASGRAASPPVVAKARLAPIVQPSAAFPSRTVEPATPTCAGSTDASPDDLVLGPDPARSLSSSAPAAAPIAPAAAATAAPPVAATTVAPRRAGWRTFAVTVVVTTTFLGLGWATIGPAPRPATIPTTAPTTASAAWTEVAGEAPLEFATLPTAEPVKPYRPLDLPQASDTVSNRSSPESSVTVQQPIVESSSYSTAGSLYQDPDVLAGHTQPVCGVAFTRDGGRIVSAGWDGTLRVWDFPTRQLLGELKGGGRLRGLAVHAQGTLALAGGADNVVRLWSLASQQVSRAYPNAGAGIRSVAFTADGSFLAWGTNDGRLSFRRTESEGEQFRFGEAGGPAIAALRFLPDRRHAVFGFGNSIRILRAGNSQRTLRLEGHEQLVSSLDLAPGGRQLVSGSWDKTIRIWSLKTGQTVRLLKHTNSVHAVAYSPDGRRLLSASGGHFSAPERFIEGVDNSVRLWNVADGRELAKYKGHDEPVLCVAFSPDGRWAVSGGVDKKVRVWDLRR